MERSPRELARDAKTASLKLRVLSAAKRGELLEHFANALEASQKQILEKNALDVQNATGTISDALMKRLQLKESKLDSAVAGIRQIAQLKEPIGKILSKTQIMKGLLLEKITVPIGVLLIIFEARPEALLQISALAIRSGNGLLLKGGKEATESNIFLHSILCEVLDSFVPEVGSGLIGLVQRREDIDDLLKLDDVIDLVIPRYKSEQKRLWEDRRFVCRGSNQLVSHIQQNTKIAVLGHADGICHVYVDADADLSMACRICVDSKADYPAACNAVETILIHSSFLDSHGFETLCEALFANGVRLYKGMHPKLRSQSLEQATSLRHEYSSLDVTLELVDSLEQAICHINTYGSGHTDSIVTQNPSHAQEFLSRVDSACVHHNASTRWSDGYRFGLGAEVGVEGLMTTKFVLNGSGQVVEGDAQKSAYQFKSLDVDSCGMKTKGVYVLGGFAAAMACSLIFQYLKQSSY